MIFFLLLEDIKIPLIGEHEKVTHEARWPHYLLNFFFYFFAVNITNKFIAKRTKFLSYIKKKSDFISHYYYF